MNTHSPVYMQLWREIYKIDFHQIYQNQLGRSETQALNGQGLVMQQA